MLKSVGNITSQGFPGTMGQTFWYISLKAMKYLLCYVYILLVKTLQKPIQNSRGNVTPADPQDVMNNPSRLPSRVQSGVLLIPKISAHSITLLYCPQREGNIMLHSFWCIWVYVMSKQFKYEEFHVSYHS